MTRDTALDAAAEALSAVVASQHDLLCAMRALALNEQDAIVRGDIEVLTAVVEEHQQLAEHLASLETERMTALVAIGDATGTDAASATLSGVAALLPPRRASALTRDGLALQAEAIALRDLQEVNARLLEQSRTLVDRWLQHLRTLLAGSLYTATGDSGGMPGGRSLDRSA